MDTPALIEKLIQQRRAHAAKTRIRGYLAEKKHARAARLEACEWYRRLGLFKEAYRLVCPEEIRLSRTHGESEREDLYWVARLLNLLGATPYAERIVSALPPRRYEEHLIAANIFLAVDECESSLMHFENALRIAPDPGTHRYKMLQLGLADSLANLGRQEEALQLVRAIPVVSEEKLLCAILKTAEGEYLCRLGRFEEALPMLRFACAFFPDEDVSNDHAFALKWLSVAQAHAGERSQAKLGFRKCMKILGSPSHRPEAWLGVFYWMECAALLSRKDLAVLRHYPGLSARFFEQHPVTISDPDFIGPKDPEILIRVSRDEWSYRGKDKLGIPLEIELLALLARSGRYGIGIERLKTLLWPEEINSFRQLDGRIRQLQHRLQALYRVHSASRDGVLTLDARDLGRVGVEIFKSSRLPLFLERNDAFSSREFAEHYELGKSQANAILRRYVSVRWVVREGSARGARYSIKH